MYNNINHTHRFHLVVSCGFSVGTRDGNQHSSECPLALSLPPPSPSISLAHHAIAYCKDISASVCVSCGIEAATVCSDVNSSINRATHPA